MDLGLAKAMSAVRLVTELLRIVGRVACSGMFNALNIDEKRQHLKRKFEELESIEADNKTELEIAEKLPRKKRKKEVDNWLTNVADLRPKVRSIQREEGQSRWNVLLGKRIDRVTEEVKELINNGKFQGKLVLDVHETKGDSFLVTKLVGKAFQVNMGKISAWLENDDAWSIGIYGMGGVGKTTLGQHFYNQLVESTDKFVCWITVLQDSSIYNLQDQVAKVIHVDLSREENEMKRAARLSKALATRPRFVFIFDNLWNQFDPKEVGIPVGVNGCKMIITTRSLDICRRMFCQKLIKLKPLQDEEPWNLFIEKLGNHQALPADVKIIAKRVARKCAGLPLRIVTLAVSLRGVDDVCEWRNVLEKMEDSEIRQGGIDDEVSRALRLSYIRLKDPILQLCFLYCALFPRNYKIKREDLIEYLIVEGILKGLKSRQADFDRGHSILNELENVCLLEGITERGSYRYVKMHDLIGDMAFQVMKETSQVMIAAGKKLKELPDETTWTEDLVRVSLMENDIQEITWSSSVRRPNLSTLLLCQNRRLTSISNCFFKQFSGLKILDLSHTAIKVLPSSVSNLVYLTSLQLRGCKQLWHIPSLAKLKELTKLDISDTGVEEVPEGLEFLSNLKYLDLYGSKIKGFPSEVLPRLPHVQLLMLGQAPKVEEVICLRKLEYLRCLFRESYDLVRYITQGLSMLDSDLRQLPSYYDLFAGEDNKDLIAFVPDISMLSRQIVFRTCSIGTNGELVAIPKFLQMLYIMNCHDASNLSSASLVEGSTELKFCEIEKCDGLEYLISVPQCFSNIFESLRILRLVALKNLRFLIKRDHEVAPLLLTLGGAFSCLKRFELFDCTSMKTLFPSSLLLNLQNLEEIVVAKCEAMEEIILSEHELADQIIVREDHNSDDPHRSIVTSSTFSLPKLKLLKLAYLPELKGIGCGKMFCNSIQEICVFECPKLKRMPFSLPLPDNGQPSPPTYLKRIMILPEEWWNAVEWDHPDIKDLLLPFKMVVHLPELDHDTLLRQLAESSRFVRPSSESRNPFFSLLEFPDDAQLDGSLVSYL